MAPIKSDLREAMLKIGSRAGRAGTTFVVIPTTATQYLAPSDGFITYSGVTSNSGTWSGLRVIANGGSISFGESNAIHTWHTFSIPVKKGEEAVITREGGATFSQIIFVPSIGGGSFLVFFFEGGSNEH